LDFNNGFIPILEVPSGELFPESGIVADYALQVAGPNQGIKLIPDDVVLASKMRVKMVKFDSEILKHFFALYGSRFMSSEFIENFLSLAVPKMEELCAGAGEDTWLMGTEDLTQLDIHCGAMWDFLYIFMKSDAMRDCFDRLDL